MCSANPDLFQKQHRPVVDSEQVFHGVADDLLTVVLLPDLVAQSSAHSSFGKVCITLVNAVRDFLGAGLDQHDLGHRLGVCDF